MKNPNGKETKEMLKIMIPLLRITGKNVPWGPLERTNELSVLYGMVQRYSYHSQFITFSQSSVSQSLVITLGSRIFKQPGESNHPAIIEDGEVIWNSDSCPKFCFTTARKSPATCA